MSGLENGSGSNTDNTLTTPLLANAHVESSIETANEVVWANGSDLNDPSILQRPEEVIGELEKHVCKLGEFEVEVCWVFLQKM